MMKKLCVTGFVVAAVAGAALVAAPAHADARNGNSSRNSESSQSGNNFANIGTSIVGGWDSTNVNNINGNAAVAADDSAAGMDVEVD
jgi:hypothetical protein